MGIPLGRLLESPSPGSFGNASSSPTRGSTVPPVPGPVLGANRPREATWEGKGLGRSHCLPVQGPDFPEKGRGRSKFSHSQAGAQSHPRPGDKLVPSLCPPSVTRILFLPALALESAQLPPAPSTPLILRSSLRRSPQSQALSSVPGPDQTYPPFIPSLQPSFTPTPESPCSRAHTCVLTSLRGRPLSPRLVLKFHFSMLSSVHKTFGSSGGKQASVPTSQNLLPGEPTALSTRPCSAGQRRVVVQSARLKGRLHPATSPVFPIRPHQVV